MNPFRYKKMTQFILRAVLSFSSCALVIGCNYKMNKRGMDDNSANPFSVENLDFAFVKSQVLEPRCVECHSSTTLVKSGVSIDTYASVIKDWADIMADIESDEMPKNRELLSTRQKQIVRAWVAQGKPEFATTGPVAEPKAPPVETSPVELLQTTPKTILLDYASVHRLVIEPTCFKCHQAPNDKGDVNLESYAEVVKNLAKVKETIEDGSMPRRTTLTDSQKKLILDWISAGAPEKEQVHEVISVR